MTTQRTILIIDDESGLRDMLAFSLSDRGYLVAIAADGEEGLMAASRMRFDLVLCDIMMPGLSGLEVLSRLRRSCPDTRVIMATGCATQDFAAESLLNGAVDFITKPYELDHLCSIFDAALTRNAVSGGKPS